MPAAGYGLSPADLGMTPDPEVEAGGQARQGVPITDFMGATAMAGKTASEIGARDTADCAGWREGWAYAVGDLVCPLGLILECLDHEACGATRPTGADSEADIWLLPTEAGFTAPPSSMAMEVSAWTRTAADAIPGYAAAAYEVGSVVKSKEGGLYLCDPWAVWPEEDFVTLWTVIDARADGTADDAHTCLPFDPDVDWDAKTCWSYEVVRGCMGYAPTSGQGADYWLDLGSEIDMAAMQPAMLLMPWSADHMYVEGDAVVDAATGDIWVLWDTCYSDVDPASSAEAARGWYQEVGFSSATDPNYMAYLDD